MKSFIRSETRYTDDYYNMTKISYYVSTFQPLPVYHRTRAPVMNKSAMTDHVSRVNHLIDWQNVKIMDHESDRTSRAVREAMWIRKTSSMNRDDGSYQLSHIWNKLLTDI